MSVVYEFPIYKTIEQDEEQLESGVNPFATVILAGLYALKAKNNEEQRFKFKQRLSKLLFKKSWKREKIIELFYYIDNIITLNDEEKNRLVMNEFESEINEEENEMKFTFDETNYAQVLRKKALAQGMERGMAQGMEKGIYMVARNLLKKGVSVEVIAETTSLPREKIMELSKLNG